MYPQFQAEGCEVYSVSEDTHFVHKAWADASETIRAIAYPMLADPAGVLARQYGVLDESCGQAYRGAFLLNPAGEVVLYEINDMFRNLLSELIGTFVLVFTILGLSQVPELNAGVAKLLVFGIIVSVGMKSLKNVSAQAPVRIGDVIERNAADTGVNVVATKNVD